MKISSINEIFAVRQLNQKYVQFLADDFQKHGFKNSHPVSITKSGTLWDGNHRLEAAKLIGLTEIPHIIETPDNIRLEAHERNRVAANSLPETFVDHAEEIWAMLEAGSTQQVVADELGWKQQRVGQYAKLQGICPDAWKTITTTVLKMVVDNDTGAVVNNTTAVVFTERLLRDITTLKTDQQLELVQDLASNTITKSKFKTLAGKYKIRNKLKKTVSERLGGIDPALISRAYTEIDKGFYDEDKNGKLDKLVQSIRDEWEEKNNIQLIHGDFYEEIKKIPDSTIDAIITDPPYAVLS